MSVNEDTLISYALGHLTPKEEAEVEAQLRAHPEDAATVAAYQELLSELVLALPPEPLLENGEAELLARVRAAPGAAESAPSAPPGRPPILRYAWLGALAAAAVVVLLYLSVLSPPNPDARVARELQNYQSQPGAVSYLLSAQGRPEPLGTLVRLDDGRVFVALEAPPEGERVYQAWDIAEAPVSLGTFDGRTFLSSDAVAEGHTFGLTLEPLGGSEQPTTTPLTLLEL